MMMMIMIIMIITAGVWGGSRNTTPLHGLAAVSAGLPDQLPMPGHCISRPHDSGGVRYTHRLQTIVPDVLWLSSHSMTSRRAPEPAVARWSSVPDTAVTPWASQPTPRIPRGDPVSPAPLQASSGTPCRTTSVHSRTRVLQTAPENLNFSLATSVLSALETMWQLCYIHSHLPLPLQWSAVVSKTSHVCEGWYGLITKWRERFNGRGRGGQRVQTVCRWSYTRKYTVQWSYGLAAAVQGPNQ